MSDRVSLFVTCVSELVEPDVAVAAVRVLRAAGCDVDVPEGQTCCGQPAWNSGQVTEAAAVAGTSLEALEADPDADIVVPAGSCATMMRLYWSDLFERAGDPDAATRARRLGARLYELCEFLETRELPPCTVEPCTVVQHRSCHQLRELHADGAAGAALDRVEGVERAAWPDDEACCGFGGTFSVKLPETSVAMADAKLDSVPSGVVEIVGTDASCLLQLRTRAEARGLGIRTRHVAEVIAEGLES